MSFNRLRGAYNSFDTKANDAASVLQNPYVAAALHIVFIGYAGKFATAIPVKHHWIFSHPLFRVAVLSLVLWTSSKNFAFSVSVMSAYVLFCYALNKRYEGFTGFQTAIYPGCTNMTQADLLEAFKGDRNALALAMQDSLVPFNLIVSDDTAPIIATYLMNHNYKIKLPCAPPGSK